MLQKRKKKIGRDKPLDKPVTQMMSPWNGPLMEDMILRGSDGGG